MVRMPNYKPDRELDTEEYIYQEFDMEDVLEGSAKDCCQLSKDTWLKTVRELEQGVNNLNRQDISRVLDPTNLDCRNFLEMLKQLYRMRPGSFATASVNKIIGRYFRIDQMKTSLLSSVATIAKSAGAEALQSWMYCAKRKQETAGTNWQETLRRDFR
tara:strand:- start:186 stop:659 length:474 start_codon:yes stop_codon:yes gene_type:complete